MTAELSTSLAAALLSPVYKLESGNSLTSGLLGNQTATESSFNILSSTFGGTSAGANQELEEFVIANVPNSEKILTDLAAVSALSTLVTSDTVNSNNSVLQTLTFPYEQTLILGEDTLNSPLNIIDSLV